MVINNLKGFLKNYVRILQPKKAAKNRLPIGDFKYPKRADFYTFFKILKLLVYISIF